MEYFMDIKDSVSAQKKGSIKVPIYAKEVASPLSNIEKITVVDTGSNGENGGANKITGYATNLMGTLQESLKASSGIDVKELLENFSGKGNVKSSN
jgi:flotillin